MAATSMLLSPRWSGLADAAVVFAACGSDDTDTTVTDTTATTAAASESDTNATVYPLTIDNCGTEIVVEAAPEQVVVVDTSLAATLVALGVSDRIVGTYFDFQNGGIDPANRSVLDTLTVLGEGGYPSREAVVTLGPDFVLAFGDGDFEQEGAATRDDLTGAAIYGSEAFGCAEGEGGVQSSFDEILDLGAIFDRQAEAQACSQSTTAPRPLNRCSHS